MTVLKLIRSSRQDKSGRSVRCKINERYTQGITSHTIDKMMFTKKTRELDPHLPNFCRMLPSVWCEKVTHSGQVGQGIFQVPWLSISLDHLSIGLCIGPNSLGTHLAMPLCCFLTQSTIGICLATCGERKPKLGRWKKAGVEGACNTAPKRKRIQNGAEFVFLLHTKWIQMEEWQLVPRPPPRPVEGFQKDTSSYRFCNIWHHWTHLTHFVPTSKGTFSKVLHVLVCSLLGVSGNTTSASSSTTSRKCQVCEIQLVCNETLQKGVQPLARCPILLPHLKHSGPHSGSRTAADGSSQISWRLRKRDLNVAFVQAQNCSNNNKKNSVRIVQPHSSLLLKPCHISCLAEWPHPCFFCRVDSQSALIVAIFVAERCSSLSHSKVRVEISQRHFDVFKGQNGENWQAFTKLVVMQMQPPAASVAFRFFDLILPKWHSLWCLRIDSPEICYAYHSRCRHHLLKIQVYKEEIEKNLRDEKHLWLKFGDSDFMSRDTVMLAVNNQESFWGV